MFLSAVAIVLSLVFPEVCVGETLEVRAGEIASGKTLDPSVVSLTLIGSVNAADLDRIALNCRSLESLDLGAVSVEPCRLDKGPATGIREFPGGVLPAYSLSGLTAKRLVLPSGISEICDGALLSAAVEELTIPESVCRIGVGALADCKALRRINGGSGLTEIGTHAFSDCTGLQAFEIPAGLRTIGDRAFAGCSSLEDLTVEVGDPALEQIGNEAFSTSGLRILDLGACRQLQTIGIRTFAECERLETAILPDGVTGIGEGIFLGCSSLQVFSLPEGIKKLPAMALTGASSMADADGLLHKYLTEIGAYSMAGMNTVASVTLPGSLGRIDDGAFEGWTSLGKIMAEDLTKVPALGEAVWAGVDQENTDLIVAKELEHDFSTAEQWKEFKIRNSEESGITGVNASDDLATRIKARFADSLLDIEADGGIEVIVIHDLAGRTLMRASGGGRSSVSLTTGLAAGTVYIVGVVLSDGRMVGLKLYNQSSK